MINDKQKGADRSAAATKNGEMSNDDKILKMSRCDREIDGIIN